MWKQAPIENCFRLPASAKAPVRAQKRADVALTAARRLEADGQPFDPQPRRSWTPSECRKVSLADILSGRYRR
jgi:hypothetical protein